MNFIWKLLLMIQFFLFPGYLAKNIQKSGPQNRIIGGYDCKSTYDYMVSLEEGRSHTCGGTLVHPRWILSAAHCEGVNSAVIGIRNLNLKSLGKTVKILYMKRHPKYDIALFRTNQPVKIDKKIYLPRTRLNKDISSFCTSALVMGWGDENKNGRPILQCVFINPVQKKKCEKIYEYKMKGYMCAFTIGKDPCYGDSGGPLICRGVQYGLVHAGMGCADEVYPGVYTSLDESIGWINSILYPARKRSKMSGNFPPGRFLNFLLIILLNKI